MWWVLWWFLVVASVVTVVVTGCLVWIFCLDSTRFSKNLFNEDCPNLPDLDDSVLTEFIKRSISDHRDIVNKKFDIIIIGSGISGMTCACLLAKAGKSVLVLEQHDTIGGFCHTFTEEGHEFPSGIHFLGFNSIHDTKLDHMPIRLFNYITSGKLCLKEFVGTQRYVFNEDGGVVGLPNSVNEKEFMELLNKEFPSESANLEKFMDHVRNAENAFGIHFALRYATFGIFPRFESFVKNWIITPLINRKYSYYRNVSVVDLLNLCHVKNAKLRTILQYPLELVNCEGRDLVFPIYSCIMLGTLKKYYVKGGNLMIPKLISQTIFSTNKNRNESHHSELLVNARVKKLLLSTKSKKKGSASRNVIGVELENGWKIHCNQGGGVISSAGLENSVSLIPLRKERLRLTRKIKDTPITFTGYHMFVFLGFEKSVSSISSENSSFSVPEDSAMLYPSKNYNFEDDHPKFLKLSPPDFEGFENHYGILCSFHNREGEERLGCTMLLSISPDWFARYKDTKPSSRGRGYEEIKEVLTDKMLKVFWEQWPVLERYVEYCDSGTPLSTQYYNNWPLGCGYGALLDKKKDEAMDEWLRPDRFSKIDGYWVTGQDVFCDGVVCCMMCGALTTSCILNRNLLLDCVLGRKSKGKSESNQCDQKEKEKSE